MANIHREIHRVIPPRPASNRALSDRFPLGRARIVADPVPPSTPSAVAARKNRFIMVVLTGVRGIEARIAIPCRGCKKGGTNEKSSPFDLYVVESLSRNV